jgi:hypothetical protein
MALSCSNHVGDWEMPWEGQHKKNIGTTGQYLVLSLLLLNNITAVENSTVKLAILGTHMNNQLNPWGSKRLDAAHTNILLTHPPILLPTNPPIILSTKYKGWKPLLHASPDPAKNKLFAGWSRSSTL